MQVQIDDLSAVQKKMSFTLAPTAVDEALDEAYAGLRTEVRMKGFRKGKVPRRVLEQRFGRHIAGEVGTKLISDAFDNAIKEHDLFPVSQPIVEKGNLKKGTEYTFTVTVEVKPTIEVNGWEGMDIEWETVDVPEADIDAELEAQLSRHSTVEVADESHSAGEGDYVLVDATFSAEGKEDKTYESLMVLVGQSMGVPIADFLSDKVKGLTTGADFSDDVEVVPDGLLEEDWNGLAAKLTLKVGEIKYTKLPELDDDFAQDLGFDTVDLLKADAQFRLGEHRGEQARARAAGRAIKSLIDTNDFEVPEGLVRQESQAILDQSYQQLIQQGIRAPRMRVEELPEETQNQVLEQARFAVRRTLILDAVAGAVEIEVTDADLDEKIAEIAEQVGQQPAAVKGLLLKNQGMDELKGRLREDKAMDVILERANIVDIEWGTNDPDAVEEPDQEDGGDAAEAAQEEEAPAAEEGAEEADAADADDSSEE